MTPKEKAFELIDKFEKTTHPISRIMVDGRQCALICVDEILNLDIRAKSEAQFVIERRIDEYWDEVKQEIERL